MKKREECIHLPILSVLLIITILMFSLSGCLENDDTEKDAEGGNIIVVKNDQSGFGTYHEKLIVVYDTKNVYQIQIEDENIQFDYKERISRYLIDEITDEVDSIQNMERTYDHAIGGRFTLNDEEYEDLLNEIEEMNLQNMSGNRYVGEDLPTCQGNDIYLFQNGSDYKKVSCYASVAKSGPDELVKFDTYFEYLVDSKI